MTQPVPIDVETAVGNRYSQGAKTVEPALCCPTSYAAKLLEVIPAEVVERDYGCGDPSQHLREGESVLDLGSGAGKLCFIASQVVGPSGRVIGIDMNTDMLEVARRNAPIVAQRVGHANTEFRRARIQDLRLDYEWLDSRLAERPPDSADELRIFEQELASHRTTNPLIPDTSIDVVISSCVLNLVRPEDKRDLFAEIFRVLRNGGRAVISDIVADEDVPLELQQNPELWSGCISGAMREDLFLQAFEEAGFHGMQVIERSGEPWQVVEGLEFRSQTIVAYKGKQGPCLEQYQAAIYRGPFREVLDDDDHRYRRGVRTAVCEKTFGLLSTEPYRSHFELIEPHDLVPVEEAKPFPCNGPHVRDPRETKGARTLSDSGSGSGSGGCC